MELQIEKKMDSKMDLIIKDYSLLIDDICSTLSVEEQYVQRFILPNLDYIRINKYDRELLKQKHNIHTNKKIFISKSSFINFLNKYMMAEESYNLYKLKLNEFAEDNERLLKKYKNIRTIKKKFKELQEQIDKDFFFSKFKYNKTNISGDFESLNDIKKRLGFSSNTQVYNYLKSCSYTKYRLNINNRKLIRYIIIEDLLEENKDTILVQINTRIIKPFLYSFAISEISKETVELLLIKIV